MEGNDLWKEMYKTARQIYFESINLSERDIFKDSKSREYFFFDDPKSKFDMKIYIPLELTSWRQYKKINA